MKKEFLIFCILLCNTNIFSQVIKGNITNTNEKPIEDIKISTNTGIVCITDKEGNFNLNLSKGEHIIYFQHINIKEKRIVVNLSENEERKIKIVLEQKTHILPDIELITKKKDTKITDILTINTIRNKDFNNESNKDITDVIQRFSGVILTDNQISIRGGSGWNAMAGSRVLVLINDIPLLSGDMGQIPWDLIPLDNIEEIKVIKGAASAIYGSSAMNGVINVITKNPNKTLIDQNNLFGFTQINTEYGVYDNPKNINLKWWNKTRQFNSTTILHSNIIGNNSFSIGLNHLEDQGYRYLEESNRKQLSLNFIHNLEKIKGVSFGVNGTLMKQEAGNFLLWESYENAYIPIDSNLFQTHSTLFHIDPFITFYSEIGKHTLKNRYMKIQLDNNKNGVDEGKDLLSETFYIDYTYQGWSNLLSSNIIIGSTISNTFSKSEIFNGINKSTVNSFYTLVEKEKNNTILSFGSRYEIISIKSEESFNYDGEEINNFGVGFPLFYAGLKHKINYKNTWRTYIGQGVRFPSIGEMSASTSVHSGTYIYPNLSLKPESGWSYELAYHFTEKRENFIIDLDIAYFLMRYKNMMEFSFAQWGTQYDIEHAYGLGFKTINIGETQIDGIELELNSHYNINKNWKSLINCSYTYMNPISVYPDSVYAQTNHFDVIQEINFNNSSSDSTILKYRYRHLMKINTEIKYKKLSIGLRLQYNDYMKNIDFIFNSDLVNYGVSEIGYPALIPGINQSRENNKDGDFLYDANIGFKLNKILNLNFIINNVTNTEIISRPTDLKSPRTYSLKLNIEL